MTTAFPALKLLIVEDEEKKLVEWRDAVTAHNADADRTGFSLDIVTSRTISDAKRQLDVYRFDAAVIDLRLQVEEGVTENNSHGNDLVRHIIAVQPLGVAIYTGQQGDAEIDSYECPQVKVMDKGDGLEQVFTWLSENKDVFLRLRGAKNAFNRETAKMFFRSIWPRWQHWTAAGMEEQALTDVVARHVVAHVHDSMLNTGGGLTHPEESYFVPPPEKQTRYR
ncbi:MAG: hypothetical protein QM776_07250 [Rhodocyclaceae bacterium]